jgi:hypothetical protein
MGSQGKARYLTIILLSLVSCFSSIGFGSYVAGHEPPALLLSYEYNLSFIKKSKEEEVIFTARDNVVSFK